MKIVQGPLTFTQGPEITNGPAYRAPKGGLTSVPNGPSVIEVADGGVELSEGPLYFAPDGGVTNTPNGPPIGELRSGGPAGYAPLEGITEVWFYGASISEFAIKGYEIAFNNRMIELGYPQITFVNKSEGGRGVAPTLAAWEAEKAAITGRSDILIETHCIGNDVSAHRPWSTLPQATRDTLINDYAAFIASVVANGNVVMPVNTSFRDYGDTTLLNESAGSPPFSENMVLPVLSSLPWDMTDRQGGCYSSLYNFSRNYYQTVLSADNVHFTRSGDQMQRNLRLQTCLNRILGEDPISIPRIDDPTTYVATPQECFTMLNETGDSNRGSKVVFGFNDVRNCTDYNLAPINSWTPNSITLTMPLSSFVTASGHYNTGDTSQSLTNDYVKNIAWKIPQTDWTTLQHLKGFNAGQEVEITICAYRNWTSGGRAGDYTVDGGATFQTLDASQLTPEHELTFTAFADAQGEVLLEGRVSTTGTNYEAYLSGTRIVPK